MTWLTTGLGKKLVTIKKSKLLLVVITSQLCTDNKTNYTPEIYTIHIWQLYLNKVGKKKSKLLYWCGLKFKFQSFKKDIMGGKTIRRVKVVKISRFGNIGIMTFTG